MHWKKAESNVSAYHQIRFYDLQLSPYIVPYLPVNLLGEELGNQTQVIWLELLNHWSLVGFRVQVVWVESEDILESLFVRLILEVGISPFTMPEVERVVSNHIKRGLGKGRLLLANHVQVLRRLFSLDLDRTREEAHLVVTP